MNAFPLEFLPLAELGWGHGVSVGTHDARACAEPVRRPGAMLGTDSSPERIVHAESAVRLQFERRLSDVSPTHRSRGMHLSHPRLQKALPDERELLAHAA